MGKPTFIDLFAGAGGLSEGFIRAGFEPIAHVEMDANACDTLKTRIAFHYLSKVKAGKKKYEDYLRGELDRDDLWAAVNKPELYKSVINAEISENTSAGIFDRIDDLLGGRKVDLVIGGPPCQAYSLVGRARDPNGMRDDPRNYLFKDYAEFLKKYKPSYFVFENVVGLLSAGNRSYFNEMQALFQEYEYAIDHKILHSEDYGVMQKRKRVVIVGKRTEESTFKFGWPGKEENDFELLEDLFSDLPALRPGDAPKYVKYVNPATTYLEQSNIRNGFVGVSQHITRNHNLRDLAIYRIAIQRMVDGNERVKYSELPRNLRTHKNVISFLDRFKVVDPKGKSHTMVAHISKDGHHYIYPDLKQVRSLSVREAARIQSFPDDYFFEGGRTAAFRQIGNAVPPLMGEKIANSIKAML